MAAWVHSLLLYADVSDSTLRATHASLAFLRMFPRQREAIAYELAVRGWAAAIEDRLAGTIAWCRGGRS
jgi:hypothetical protein